MLLTIGWMRRIGVGMLKCAFFLALGLIMFLCSAPVRSSSLSSLSSLSSSSSSPTRLPSTRHTAVAAVRNESVEVRETTMERLTRILAIYGGDGDDDAGVAASTPPPPLGSLVRSTTFVCIAPTLYTQHQIAAWNVSNGWYREGDHGVVQREYDFDCRAQGPIETVWPPPWRFNHSVAAAAAARWSMSDQLQWINANAATFVPVPFPAEMPASVHARDLGLIQNNLLYAAVPLPICDSRTLEEYQFDHQGFWSLSLARESDATEAVAVAVAASAAQEQADERRLMASTSTNGTEALRRLARVMLTESNLRDALRPDLAAARAHLHARVGALGTGAAATPKAFESTACNISREFIAAYLATPATLRATIERAWDLVYSPTYCHLLPVSYTALVETGALRRQRWMFIGDSLTRYSWVVLMHFIALGRWPAPGAHPIDGPSISAEFEWRERGGWAAMNAHLRALLAPYLAMEPTEFPSDERQMNDNWVFRHPTLQFESVFVWAPGVGAYARSWDPRRNALSYDAIRNATAQVRWRADPTLVVANCGIWDSVESVDLTARVVAHMTGWSAQFPATRLAWRSTTLDQEVESRTPTGTTVPTGRRQRMREFERVVGDAARAHGHWYVDIRTLTRDLTQQRRVSAQWDQLHFWSGVYNQWNNFLLTRLCRECHAWSDGTAEGRRPIATLVARNRQWCSQVTSNAQLDKNPTHPPLQSPHKQQTTNNITTKAKKKKEPRCCSQPT
jgi:hypothetical protein